MKSTPGKSKGLRVANPTYQERRQLSDVRAPSANGLKGQSVAGLDINQTMIEIGVWIETELKEQNIRPSKSEVFQKALKVLDFLTSLETPPLAERTTLKGGH